MSVEPTGAVFKDYRPGVTKLTGYIQSDEAVTLSYHDDLFYREATLNNEELGDLNGFLGMLDSIEIPPRQA